MDIIISGNVGVGVMIQDRPRYFANIAENSITISMWLHTATLWNIYVKIVLKN
jgi:hypothetical protein